MTTHVIDQEQDVDIPPPQAAPQPLVSPPGPAADPILEPQPQAQPPPQPQTQPWLPADVPYDAPAQDDDDDAQSEPLPSGPVQGATPATPQQPPPVADVPNGPP